jgi:hypothetical protein
MAPELISVANSERFELTDNIWIERLDEELTEMIRHACQPPQHNIPDYPSFSHRYAFVSPMADRENAPYEGMKNLLGAIALSRLVHPTSTGLRYCVRIHNMNVPEHRRIEVITYQGISPDIVTAPDIRDWLTEADALEVRKLMVWLPESNLMHRRTYHAYWNHEYTMRLAQLDIRWIFVVSGLEALISIGESDLKRQFKYRVFQLADKFGIQLTDDELERAYKVRSKLAHAESFLSALHTLIPPLEQNDLYERMERLLRVTVKRCLLDKQFGDIFTDGNTVEAHWPLPPIPRKT